MTTAARSATSDDIPILAALMDQFYRESGYSLDRQWAVTTFSTLISRPNLGAAWVLLDDNRPVGFAVLTVRFSMEHGGMEGCIDDLFVDAAHRRRGLARRGLEAVFRECDRREVIVVSVIVGADNLPAKALYAEHGFRAGADHRVTLTVRTDPPPGS